MTGFGAKWGELQLALALLTRLPTGRFPDPPPETGEAAWAFPIVGLIVGLITGLMFIVPLSLIHI